MAPNNSELSFIPLLMPLIDAAKETDISLSEYLQAYLNYVREHDVYHMNFPQAAMLIQNSANIYGKKVDCLFNITVELLEILRKKQLEDGKQHKEKAVKVKVDRRKKKMISDEIDNFVLMDDFCTAQCIDSEDIENLTKEKKVPLNAAIKVKPKENTCINVYDVKNRVLGKKTEFRLHWRMSSFGTLVEQFSPQNLFVPQPILYDDTIDYEGQIEHNLSLSNGAEEQPDVIPNGIGDDLNLPNGIVDEVEHHSFQHLASARQNRLDENVVNSEEVDGLQWLPLETYVEIPEKPTKRKKVTKIPEEVQDAKKENKRKWSEFSMILSSYDISYFLMIDRCKQQNVFDFDGDLLTLEKKEQRLKKQLILKRRKKFNEILAREARQELNNDFHGFHDMEPDELDGFGGFNDDNDDDDDDGDGNKLDNCDNNNGEVDVPLPGYEMFHQNGVEQVLNNSYEDEALRVLQQHRLQKNHYQSQMMDLAKRVAAWHDYILPKLEAAEERAHFDIHEYGTRILDRFPRSKGKFTLPFSEIVTNEPAEEVARFFLSSLMLANTYNIEISKSDPRELSVDCMNLTLLSCVRHYDELDDNMRVTSNDQH